MSLTTPSRRRLAFPVPMSLWGLLATLLMWWLATTPLWHSGIVGDFSPERTFAAMAQMVTSGAIFPHIGASLRRVLVGLFSATLIGIPLGLLIGLSRAIEQATSVLFQFARMISPVSWMPVAVMVFGIGDWPVYFLLTVSAVWPLMLNAAAGVASVDRRWLLLSRSLCATRWETVTRVIVPATIPHLLTGLRLAVGIIWIVLVPAEMLGVRAGLGYFILDTRDRLAYSELMAIILMIGLIGYGLDSALRWANQAWTHQA